MSRKARAIAYVDVIRMSHRPHRCFNAGCPGGQERQEEEREEEEGRRRGTPGGGQSTRRVLDRRPSEQPCRLAEMIQACSLICLLKRPLLSRSFPASLPCIASRTSSTEQSWLTVTSNRADPKSSTGTDAAQGRNREAGNAAAPLRQKDDNGSTALLSNGSPRVDSAKVPPSPQRSHVRGTGRRAANVSPAGNASAKVEWAAVPGQHSALEQNAEWQAAGGRQSQAQHSREGSRQHLSAADP